VSFNGAGIIKIRFVNSEQRSLHESAVRLAWGFTGKHKIIKFASLLPRSFGFIFLIQAGSMTTFGSQISGVTPGTAQDTLAAHFEFCIEINRRKF
jgi:glutamate-1-semialdehyde aminotransferase